MTNPQSIQVKKSAPVISFDFLAGHEVLVLHTKKNFKHFTKRGDFETLYGAWDDNGRSCVAEHDGTCWFVLVLRNHSMRVIVHECVHMVHQICDHRGIPVSSENSEVIAYMTDYLVGEVVKAIRPDLDID